MLICALFLGVSFSIDKVKTDEAEARFAQLQQGIGAGISHARVEFGDFPFRRNNIRCRVNNTEDLRVLASYLEKAELRSQSGHVLPLLEFEMHLQFASGAQSGFLGWIYDAHPNDIFLQSSLWEKEEEGIYHRDASPPIKISKAGPWIQHLLEQCAATKKSISY